MKKLLLTVVFILIVASFASAEPYFRLINPKAPQINAGLSIGADYTRQTTMLALVTHSSADGLLYIVGVDWTPLAIGGGFKDGAFHLAVGPSVNILPTMQIVLGGIVDAITPAGKYNNLKSWIEPSNNATGDITGAVGMNMEYDLKKITFPFFVGAKWVF